MKRIALLALLTCVSVVMFAQATDLVVDNQNPGWLSYVISFSDQQTVKNLKITGYINGTDLQFIGTLMNNRSLDGTLDLSEVNVVDVDGKDNYLGKNSFGLSKTDNIDCVHLPKTCTLLKECFNGKQQLLVDTLYYDCNTPVLEANYVGILPSTLIIGENVESVRYFGGSSAPGSSLPSNYKRLKTVYFPSTLKYIDDGAFSRSHVDKTNFHVLHNLEYLGDFAFVSYTTKFEFQSEYVPDTLIVPNIKKFNSGSFLYKDNEHIFLSETIDSICASEYSAYGSTSKYGICANKKLIFIHVERNNPPFLYSNLSNTCTVYVPKGAKENYMKDTHWSNANIIEANPLETILLDKHSASMEVGEILRLIPTFIPSDADDKTLEWSVKDESVAKVENGVVTALAPGKTWVYAMSVVEDVMDSCEVTVIQHVTDITFDTPALTIEGIGATAQLNVIVTPEDATDKSVTWTSSNPSVCVVSNGKIVSVGYGMSVVIATSVDGGHMAVATVNVSEATNVKAAETSDISVQGTSFGVRILNAANETANIYTPDGVLVKTVKVTGAQMDVELPEGGIYLVKVADKTVKVSR